MNAALFLLLFDGDGEAAVSTALVGVWCDPIIIEALGTQTLFAGNNRTELEAGDSY